MLCIASVRTFRAGKQIGKIREGGTHKWGNSRAEKQRHNVCPPWKRDVLLQDDDKSEDEADNQYTYVPPPGHLFVILVHVIVMDVPINPLFGALESLDNVTSPEEDTVGDQGTNLNQVSLILF